MCSCRKTGARRHGGQPGCQSRCQLRKPRNGPVPALVRTELATRGWDLGPDPWPLQMLGFALGEAEPGRGRRKQLLQRGRLKDDGNDRRAGIDPHAMDEQPPSARGAYPTGVPFCRRRLCRETDVVDDPEDIVGVDFVQTAGTDVVQPSPSLAAHADDRVVGCEHDHTWG